MNKLLLRNTTILELLRFKDSFYFAISDALGKNKLGNKHSVIMFLKNNSESLFYILIRIDSFKSLMDKDNRADLDRECEDLLVATERILRIYESFYKYCGEYNKKPHFSAYKLRVIGSSLRDNYDRQNSVRHNYIINELLQNEHLQNIMVPFATISGTHYTNRGDEVTGDGVQIIGRPSQVEDPF